MRHLKFRQLSVCVALLVASCAAQGPQPFSADFVTIPGKGGERVPGKFYFSPPKIRMDMANKGQSVSMIADSTAQTSYMIMHQQHVYMEISGGNNPMMRQAPKIDTSYDPNNPCGDKGRTTCKKVGTETINGRMCDKYESTSDSGTSTFWVDQKLRFPIKTQAADGSGMELSNLKEGPPEASLFQVPAGYRKMDLGGMMGGMGTQPPH